MYKNPKKPKPVVHSAPTDPSLSIPKVPLRKPGIIRKTTKLEDIVFCWENAAPEFGLHVALKDWKPEWYTGRNTGVFGALRGQRQIIAEEYIIE